MSGPHHTIGTAEKQQRRRSSTTLVTPTPKKLKTNHDDDTITINSNALHRTNSSTSSSGPGVATPSTSTLPSQSNNNASSNSASTAYSRKKKSLGVLAENFLKTYQSLPEGATIVVDEAAVNLGVERRRIYDVVNILESICLVCKKHKNTYSWIGLDRLDSVFGRLQEQALEDYPQDAMELMGVSPDDIAASKENIQQQQQHGMFTGLTPVTPTAKASKKGQKFNSRENKSLARLSQDFLQVFLVGHKTLSLPEASDKIQGTTSMEELIALGHQHSASTAGGGDDKRSRIDQLPPPPPPSDPKEMKAAAARGLKTKIRRLYDIANVFLSVGLLRKVDSADSSRRPNFSWSYPLSARDIYDLHRQRGRTAVQLRHHPTTHETTTSSLSPTMNSPHNVSPPSSNGHGQEAGESTTSAAGTAAATTPSFVMSSSNATTTPSREDTSSQQEVVTTAQQVSPV